MVLGDGLELKGLILVIKFYVEYCCLGGNIVGL